MKKLFFSIWEVVEVVFIAGITVFLIRSFLIQPFLVSGASMEPNFSNGNYLLVDEITYRFREPNRGEVVVFRYPLDHSVFFIKRIIGLPGEHIISEDGTITIETVMGETITIKEEYISTVVTSEGNFDVMLQSDQYFVMGDNRNHSLDSRRWGAINRDDIVGVARLRVLPLDSFGFFEFPIY
jgi:signal peptidase I